MARKRVVSRTILSTDVTAMVTNIDAGEVQNVTLTLTGKVAPDKLDKKLRKMIEESNPSLKYNCVVHIAEPTKALYEMDEEQFLMTAKRVVK